MLYIRTNNEPEHKTKPPPDRQRVNWFHFLEGGGAVGPALCRLYDDFQIMIMDEYNIYTPDCTRNVRE